MTQFFSAFQLYEISREEVEGGAIASGTQEALFHLIADISKEHHGVLVQSTEDRGIYSYTNIALAVKAGIAIQKKIDLLNTQHPTSPICLASIGIVALVNPFTGQAEEQRSLELGAFLADAASAGELYLSEGAYDSLSNPETLSCRFVRQLIRTGESWALNAYEVFWVHTEVELGKFHKFANEVDVDLQPIRSFGLKLFMTILLLFFAVLVMTIGLEPLWALFIKVIYK